MALTGVAFAQNLAQTLTEEERRQGFSNRTVLAKARDSLAAVDVTAAESREGVKLHRAPDGTRRLRVLEPAAGETVPQAVNRLQVTGRYEFVEPDYVRKASAVPNDPRYIAGDQWSLRNVGQSSGKAGADVSAEDAWSIQSDARSVIVRTRSSSETSCKPRPEEPLPLALVLHKKIKYRAAAANACAAKRTAFRHKGICPLSAAVQFLPPEETATLST
jgi:hypothetical protein